MTQKELHDQRLVKEAQATARRMHTRRHFLKESAMGLGCIGNGFVAGRLRWPKMQLLHPLLHLIRHIHCCLSRHPLLVKQEV